MQVIPLPEPTEVAKRSELFVDVGFADIVAAAGGVGAVTLNPFTVKGNRDMIEVSHIETLAALVSSDATLISTTLQAGDAGNAARLLAATELNAAGASVNIAAGTGTRYAPAADTLQVLTFTPTAGKNLNTLTAGQVRVYYRRLVADLTP